MALNATSGPSRGALLSQARLALARRRFTLTVLVEPVGEAGEHTYSSLSLDVIHGLFDDTYQREAWLFGDVWDWDELVSDMSWFDSMLECWSDSD